MILTIIIDTYEVPSHGLKKRAKKLLVLRSISLAIVGIYGLVVLAVFSYYILIIEKENKTLKEGITNQTKIIEDLRPIETKQVYLAVKTKSLSEILPAKKKYQQVLESFLRLLPLDIFLTNLDIKEDGTVNFSGRCFSFISLDNFFTVLSKEEQRSSLQIKETRIKELSYGFNEGYFFDISLLFFNEEEFNQGEYGK